MQRGVVAREPVPGRVVPPVAAVVQVELGAFVAEGVHAGLCVDQQLLGQNEIIKKKSFITDALAGSHSRPVVDLYVLLERYLDLLVAVQREGGAEVSEHPVHHRVVGLNGGKEGPESGENVTCATSSVILASGVFPSPSPYLGMRVPFTQSVASTRVVVVVVVDDTEESFVQEAIRMESFFLSSSPLQRTSPSWPSPPSLSLASLTAASHLAEKMRSPERKMTLFGLEVTASPQRRSQCQGQTNWMWSKGIKCGN